MIHHTLKRTEWNDVWRSLPRSQGAQMVQRLSVMARTDRVSSKLLPVGNWWSVKWAFIWTNADIWTNFPSRKSADSNHCLRLRDHLHVCIIFLWSLQYIKLYIIICLHKAPLFSPVWTGNMKREDVWLLWRDHSLVYLGFFFFLHDFKFLDVESYMFSCM